MVLRFLQRFRFLEGRLVSVEIVKRIISNYWKKLVFSSQASYVTDLDKYRNFTEFQRARKI